MRVAKPRNRAIRPIRAGLAKLQPMPPNSCLMTTMAMKAPTTQIHSGIFTGRFMARMMPVTTADRSPTGLGFFSSRVYRYSNPTQAATVTPVTSSARMPKMKAAATIQGTRAITTLPIRPRVVELSRICGEAVTIRRCSSIVTSLPFRFSLSGTRPWPAPWSGTPAAWPGRHTYSCRRQHTGQCSAP